MIINFEGIDGSGKTTQFQLLKNYLENKNITPLCFKFPNYNNTMGGEVGKYLNGKYGKLEETLENAKLISNLYALDRYEILGNNNFYFGGIVLFDRYVLSNIALQGAKVRDTDFKEFFDYIMNLEFNILHLPIPDVILYFNVSGNNAILKNRNRDYTKKEYDLHEEEEDFLNRANDRYLTAFDILNTNPHNKSIFKIDCLNSEDEWKLPEQIHNEVLNIIRRFIDIE